MPLFVIEFLHRVVDTFEDYFNECNETIIKENYVVIYELLEEMLDNGFPLATESNILKELIKPPNILRSIANTVTGKTNFSDTLPVGSLSAIPWRRSGVKYTNNEAYFDVIEEVDAIIDRSGSTVFAEIQGYIDCLVKLSGMPDLSLSFVNPRLLDDVSFHPCVRFKRWETERVLSFIPPDVVPRDVAERCSDSNLRSTQHLSEEWRAGPIRYHSRTENNSRKNPRRSEARHSPPKKRHQLHAGGNSGQIHVRQHE
jgi:AP-3 complex subunit mu